MSYLMKSAVKRGFTIVELSVVLVIIGLLVAGIAAGSSMIHQAELRSVINDLQNFQTAYSNFVSFYKGPPGDISSASTYWADGVCGSPATICDGNDNGTIDSSGGEFFAAPKELSLAGMINAGIPVVTNSTTFAPENFPVSKLNASSYIFVSFNGSGLATIFGNGNLVLAENLANNNGGTVLSSIDAFTIDQKIDDGTISNGNFYGALTGSFLAYGKSDCITPSFPDLTQTTYNTTTTTISCFPLFKLK